MNDKIVTKAEILLAGPFVCYVCTEGLNVCEPFVVVPWRNHMGYRHADRCPRYDRKFPKEARG
jgi:hypothetical protein